MNTLLEFFHKLYHFDELIRWGGHGVLVAIVFAETGILAGFFLPGDSLLVTAGVLSSAGYMNVWVLLLELSVAAIAGDTVNYLIGRKMGDALFQRDDSFFFRKSHVERTHRFYEQYGAKTIVIARFVPIVRTFAPAVAGVAKMNYSKFITYNVIGGLAWVFSTLLLGYFLGHSVPHIDKHIHKVILVVIFVSFLPILWEYWKNRRTANA
jgi:membrane-associated protein